MRKDFSNIDIHQLIKIVGKDKADSVINAVKKFEEPIINIAEEILISVYPDGKYQHKDTTNKRKGII